MPTSKSKQKIWDDLKNMVAAEETGFVKDQKIVRHLAMAAEIISRRHGCDFWKALQSYPLYVVAVDPRLSKHTLRQRLKQVAGAMLAAKNTALWPVYQADVEKGRAAGAAAVNEDEMS